MSLGFCSTALTRAFSLLLQIDITSYKSYISSCRFGECEFMAVMSIRIKDEDRKLLKALASLEGRTMTEVVSELLGEYLTRRTAHMARSGKSAELQALMKLSESCFLEWDNKEDEIYDGL